MGFVAPPDLSPQSIELGVQSLSRLSHRGGLDADGKSGDGAGLLIQVPHRLLGDFAVAALFEWDERAQDIVAASLAESGMELVEWRKVPVDAETLGEKALATIPGIWHGLIPRPNLDPDEWERRLYMVRRRAEKRAEAGGGRMYLPSLSGRPPF